MIIQKNKKFKIKKKPNQRLIKAKNKKNNSKLVWINKKN